MIADENGTDMKIFRLLMIIMSFLWVGNNAFAFSCRAPEGFNAGDAISSQQATLALFKVKDNEIIPIKLAGKPIFQSGQSYKLSHFYCPANMVVEPTPLDGDYVMIMLIDGKLEGKEITLRMSGCCGRDAYSFYNNEDKALQDYNRTLRP